MSTKRKYIKKALFILAILLIAGAIAIKVKSSLYQKDYTIMVYLSGTDLESGYGAATLDIEEMLEAYINEDKINLVIQTGGTKMWHTEEIKSDKNMLLQIQDDDFTILKEDRMSNMGKAETLTNFINYCTTNFPAKQYMLVFWDHGGGSVEGVCLDEWYDYDRLTLDEIDNALSNTDLKKNKLELIGFDTCLMATAETAHMVSKYSNYMIASEEFEPGGGWDYSFLTEMSKDSKIKGDILGDKIARCYYESYPDSWDKTISVIDLSKMENFYIKLENFFNILNTKILQGNMLENIAHIRADLFEFGFIYAYNQSSNMIDLVDFTEKFSNTMQEESNELINALEETILYNYSNIDGANGLSIFYPYKNKAGIPILLEKYSEIKFFPKFEKFLYTFHKEIDKKISPDIESNISQLNDDSFDIQINTEVLEQIQNIYMMQWQQSDIDSNVYLRIGSREDITVDNDGKIENVFDGQWFLWNDNLLPIEVFDGSKEGNQYYFSSMLNGEEVKIIMEFDNVDSVGKILGAIPKEDYNMPVRILRPVETGDIIQIIYEINIFGEDTIDFNDIVQGYTDGSFYYESAFAVKDLSVEFADVKKGDYIYGYCFADYAQNLYLSDFIGITFNGEENNE